MKTTDNSACDQLKIHLFRRQVVAVYLVVILGITMLFQVYWSSSHPLTPTEVAVETKTHSDFFQHPPVTQERVKLHKINTKEYIVHAVEYATEAPVEAEAPAPTTSAPVVVETLAPAPTMVKVVETPAPAPVMEEPLNWNDPMNALKKETGCVELGSGHLEGRFVKEGACFTRKQVQEILINLVVDLSSVFEHYGITYFLDSGSFLGAYRHKSIIPFDQDADMGIDEAGYIKLRDNPIDIPEKYHLQVWNSSIHPQETRFKELPVRFIHKDSALYVDVFVYLDSHDAQGNPMVGPLPSGCFINCRQCPKIGDLGWEFKIPRDWIYPLNHCAFANHSIPCPNKAHEYLVYMFGDDYMTPEKFPY